MALRNRYTKPINSLKDQRMELDIGQNESLYSFTVTISKLLLARHKIAWRVANPRAKYAKVFSIWTGVHRGAIIAKVAANSLVTLSSCQI